VIGGGFIASQVHLPILACIDEVQIGYVADVRDTSVLANVYKIKSVKVEGDLSTLPTCDIALLAIPVGVREKYIQEFSGRRTAIFSEKPFAVDLASHKRFLKGTDKIGCDYMSTCYGSVNQVKSLLLSGVLGEVKGIAISEGRIIGPTARGSDHYQERKELAGGGILMERGCQTIAQLLYILEGCRLSVESAEMLWQDDLDIDMDARLHVSGSWDFDLTYRLSMIRPLGNSARIVFDHAEVVYDHYDPGSVVKIANETGDNTAESEFELAPDRTWASTYTQAHHLKWKRFLDQVAGRAPIDPEVETSVETTRLIEDLYSKAMERAK